MFMSDSALTASRSELRDSPSVSDRSASRGRRSPGPSWPLTIISLIRRIASSVSAMSRFLCSGRAPAGIIGARHGSGGDGPTLGSTGARRHQRHRLHPPVGAPALSRAHEAVDQLVAVVAHARTLRTLWLR